MNQLFTKFIDILFTSLRFCRARHLNILCNIFFCFAGPNLVSTLVFLSRRIEHVPYSMFYRIVIDEKFSRGTLRGEKDNFFSRVHRGTFPKLIN